MGVVDLLHLIREWADPAAHLIAPGFGGLVGWLLGRRKRQSAEDEASAAQTNAITHRFDTLMDGYEHQIDALVEEITRLRNELKETTKVLGNRRVGDGS